MVNDCFLLSLFSYAFFVSSHAALRKNFKSLSTGKNTGDLSLIPVSDNKLCYTPERDDDVPQRENLTFGQKSHRAFSYAVVLNSKTISLLDSSNNNFNAPFEQILQTSD